MMGGWGLAATTTIEDDGLHLLHAIDRAGAAYLSERLAAPETRAE